MHTAIGKDLRSAPSNLATASVVTALVILTDFALVLWTPFPERLQPRWVVALLALIMLFRLVHRDRASMGFRFSPVQGWLYWGVLSLWLGLAVLICIVVGLGALVLLGYELPMYSTPPRQIGPAFLRMCVFTPVLEETIYRIVICVPLTVLLGPWNAIVVSGLVFGALHVAYGNPSPENLVGGFLLAWAYLKSESIAVPLLLHGTGNLFALAGQVAAWWWLNGFV